MSSYTTKTVLTIAGTFYAGYGQRDRDYSLYSPSSSEHYWTTWSGAEDIGPFSSKEDAIAWGRRNGKVYLSD